MARAKMQTMEKPVWLKYTAEEVKAIIVKLANKGLTSEKIGLTLRDQYGIPKVKLYNIKVKKVLEENGKYEEPTLLNLKNKVDKIEEHKKSHKQDKKSHRALIINKAKLIKREHYQARRLSK